MKILIATDNRYWRKSLGSQQRIASLIDYLKSAGFELKIFFIGGASEEDMGITVKLPADYLCFSHAPISPSSQRIQTKQQNWKTRLRHVLRVLVRAPAELVFCVRTRRLPHIYRLKLAIQEPGLGDFFNEAALHQYSQIVESWQPDVLLVEYVRLSYLVENLPASVRRGVRAVLDTHDLIHERRHRFHAQATAHDISITAAEESKLFSLYDAIIAIQSADAAKISALMPKSTVIVAGHPQALAAAERSCSVEEERAPRFLFLGSDMLPNQQAAQRLAYQLWPKIQAQLAPGASLTIAGKACSALDDAQQRALPAGIHTLGFVENLDVLYQSHDIFLNPVNFGGGLKIKNVEAMAQGLALVTTPIGAEGLEDGQDLAYLLAPDDQSFCDLAVALGRLPAKRVALGAAAKQYSATHFGADTVFAELIAYLKSGIGKP